VFYRLAVAVAMILTANAVWAQQPAAKSLKMPATWPTAVTAWDNFLPDILVAFLKAWDQVAAEESAKNPLVLESQKSYASLVVPGEAIPVSALLVRCVLLLARG